MARGSKDRDEAMYGRDSLFRRKLNELRTTGVVTGQTALDSLNRTTEMAKNQYLQQVQHSMAETSPEELNRLTNLDGTTELYNNSTIMRILKDEMKRARRYKYPVTLLMASIDGFKEIEGRFGRFAADSVLKGLGNLLMLTIRDVDIPARYDGDTLMVICPQTDMAGCAVLAERLLHKVATERISDVGQNWMCTISIGLASFPTSATKDEDLARAAHKALDIAQVEGGNRFATVP